MTTNNFERLVKLTRPYGSATTDAILDPQTEIFTLDGIKGFIGYRRNPKCLVVYGDPVCAAEDRYELVTAFHQFCEQQRLSNFYLIATQSFTSWALDHGFQACIEYGEELHLDPFNDPRSRSGINAQLVRRKYRRAEKEGVVIHELLESNPELEREIEQVGDVWQQNRQGPQVHISHIRLFIAREGKRWFYATQNDRVIGVIVLNRLEARQGWLMNHLMLLPSAPAGTSEMLVLTVIDNLRKEGSHYVTFGNVAATKINNTVGLSKIKSFLAKSIYPLVMKMFKLDSKKTFWEKFHPESQKSYLLFPKSRIGITELRSLINALNVKIQ